MITKICPICGKEFSEDSAFNKVYCSRSCYMKGTAKPENKSVFICQWCGKDFVEWTYRQPKFCSRQCNNEHAAHQPKPLQRRPENFVTVCCEQCGKEYVVHKCMVEKRHSRFCSRKCMGEYQSLHMQGINHPRYKGGTEFPNRGSNWVTQRRLALKRDGCTCQMCGCKSTKTKRQKIEVHHIVPYKIFKGDYLAANDLLNLITLCRKCHTLVEHHGLPCPQRMF